MENEMDAELRVHMEPYAEDLQRKGAPREEAVRRARIEFGGVERAKEECRDARGLSFTETSLQDLRYGARALRKSPGFTAIAVLTLALGIGANTAIFSVVNAILLHPLAYKDADRLATILNDGNGPISVANYIDWREQSHSFEAMGAAEYWSPNLTGVDQPENIRGHKITYDLFPLLGAQPLLGRLFTEADDRAGSEHEVILSYRLWQRRFSADPNVFGKVIRLNGEAYSVVGVMPRDFQFAPFWATNAELWVPIAFGDRVHNRAGNSLRVFGRLKPGVTLDQARAEITTISAPRTAVPRHQSKRHRNSPERESCWQGGNATFGFAGRGGIRAPDGVRERGPHAPGARRFSAERVCGARRSGSGTNPGGPAIPHREFAARGTGWCTWTVARVLGDARIGGAQPGEHSSRRNGHP
jgi:putative ABC transport system permease protein